MFTELTKNRRRALQLLAEHIRFSSKELSIQAIISDINEDDMKWVTGKIHYYPLMIYRSMRTPTAILQIFLS